MSVSVVHPLTSGWRRALALSLVTSGLVLAGAQSGETASPVTNKLFAGAEVVSDQQLNTLRGGFSVPTMPNVSFNFGITVTTSVSSINLPDVPDVPDVPTVTVETNIMFDDNGGSFEAPKTGTVTSVTKVNNQVVEETSQSDVDFSQTSFKTQNSVKVSGNNIEIETGSGFGDIADAFEAPDVGIPDTPDLVLLNSFSSSLVGSIIANTLNGIAIAQTTTLNIDVNGFQEFQKAAPATSTLNALHSFDNSLIMSLTQ